MIETMIPIGRFFFKWRNLVFPLIVIGIYALIKPTPELVSLQVLLAITLIALGVFIRMAVIGFFDVARDGQNKTAHADELFGAGCLALAEIHYIWGI